MSQPCSPSSLSALQMVGWGIWELARGELEAAKQRSQPQPTQTVYAPGSVEWFAAQKKSS